MKNLVLLLVAVLFAAQASAQSLLGNRLNRSPRTTALNQTAQNGNTTTAANATAGGAAAGVQNAAMGTAAPGASKVDVGGRSIEFNGAALDIVLMVYGNLVGKTVLKDPSVPAAAITLQPKQGQDLTDEDKILAIETVLEMNGVHLEPYGEKFVRAIPRGNARKDGIPLLLDADAELGDSTRVVSLMMTFNNIPLDEAQKALEGLKSDKGVLNVYERTSSILVTDTEMIICRMREIAKQLDKPTPVLENVFVRQIVNASASEIRTVLQGIVDDAKNILEKQGKGAGNTQAQNSSALRPGQLPSRTLRPGQQNNQPATPTVNESLVTSVSDADRGMIRGNSLIIEEPRSNKLVIKTLESNMIFFDKIIKDLDVPTTPDTVVKVYRLKYANAEDVSDMINDLIGNAASAKSSSKNQNQNAKAGTNSNLSRSSSTTSTASTPKTSANQRSGEAKAGELSKDNTTVLADERINGLVVMTNKELVPVIESIIESMDIKLSQVLIETCIIEVTLGDDLKTGVDWVQNKWTGEDPTGIAGGGGGSNAATLGALTSASGGDKTYSQWAQEAAQAMKGSSGSGSLTAKDIQDYIANATKFAENNSTVSPIGAGINYFMKSDRLNISAVISASKSDSRAKYIASPVVMTVDNKEATIEATESRKFYSGSTTSSGSYNSNVSYNYTDKDLGIKIKVTPKINPNGTVMLEVEEEYSQIGAGQSMLVSTNTGAPSRENVDTALTRKMSADVILENRQTVVLGGLTEKLTVEKESGIPILKDIPWIGKWLFGSVEQNEARKELLVFMTPYVINDAEEAEKKAEQLKKSMSEAKPWDDNGWSESRLADPVSRKELLRRQRDEWKTEDQEYAARQALEEAKEERVKLLLERAAEEEARLNAKEEE